MSETPKTQQFSRRRSLRFLFIFRISPGFFVGFIPFRQRYSDYHPGFPDNSYGGHYDDDMCIQRINEQEFMFLRRIGVPEMNVIS